MITTTTFTNTVTITTDDAGRITTSRTADADTVSACLFGELTPEAQQRAISDAIEEEEEDYYSGHTYSDTEEILTCARDLERQQPVGIRQDYGCSWYGTARRYRWSTADWQAVTEATDDGICWSMDLCDVWNEYARRIVTLQEGHEEATDRAWIHHENADTAHDNGAREIEEAERQRASIYEDIAERIEETAEELTEEAARAVGNTVDSLIESQRDYYTSADFWREWLDDGETRFTPQGKRI